MLTNRFGRLAVVCMLGLTLAAVVRAENLTIPGSDNPEYVLGELAKAFNSQQDRHRVKVPPSNGTAGGIRDVEQGVASLGRVGRPLNDAERNRGLTFVPLGRDAVVFVAGAGVTVRRVTEAQMFGAFTGKIVDWRELGGKPGPIRAIGREATDASLQAVGRQLKSFNGILFHENVKLVHFDPHLIELLDRYPTSLGFINRSQLSAAKTKLVPLEIDGMEPTPENVASGSYPMALEYGLIYRPAALTDAARAFLAFVESPAGARILRLNGVVPTGRTPER